MSAFGGRRRRSPGDEATARAALERRLPHDPSRGPRRAPPGIDALDLADLRAALNDPDGSRRHTGHRARDPEAGRRPRRPHDAPGLRRSSRPQHGRSASVARVNLRGRRPPSRRPHDRTATRSSERRRSRRWARSATRPASPRCSPRRPTSRRSDGGRSSPSPRSRVRRSTRRCAERPRTATGRSVRSPRTCCHAPDGQRRASEEHDLQRLVRLDAVTGAEHDALERRVDEVHRDLRLALDPQVEAAQHATAADEVHAVGQEVLGQLGRRLAEAGDDRRRRSPTPARRSPAAPPRATGSTVFGRPLMRSRPRTSARSSPVVG